MSARPRFVALDADDDPTGTSDIRDAFASDLTARWALLRRLVQEAAPVISGAGKATAGVAGWLGLDRAGPFREWLDTAMERTLLEGNGAWVNPYIQQAVEVAERRAVSIGGAPLGHSFTSDLITLQSVAVSELRGICAAVLQQASRQAAVMALGRASPEAITAAIFSRIDALGKSRSHQMAGYMVVKAHALATLASFRGAGVTQVGLVPENVPPEPVQPEPDRVKEATEVAAAATLASMAGLAATPTKPMARWEAAAMRRAAGEEEPAEEVIEAPHEVELRRLAAAAAGVTVTRHGQPAEELAGLPWAEAAPTMLNIVNANDLACKYCKQLAAEGPYPIDVAMGLIPAHPNCLCTFVPVANAQS